MSQPYSDSNGSYELSGLVQNGDYHMETGIGQNNTSDPGRRRPSEPTEATRMTLQPDTEFLNGLRGLAALFVFIQHGIGGFGLGFTELGFGQDGAYQFTTIPFLRVFFSGGNCAVSIFFILSGYVLSIGPLRKLKQSQDISRRLVSALIRRPIRLYLAPFATSFIFAILLHVPGPLVLPTPVVYPQEDFLAEWRYFADKTWDFFRLNRPHGSHLFSYPYNIVMWTLPIELKGSIMIYGLLFMLSLGIEGVDERAPFMVAALLFCTAATMLYRAFYWSMAAFLLGVMLALIDTWPAIETRIGDMVEQRPAWMKQFVEISTPLGLRRRCLAMTVRFTPSWMLEHIPESSSKSSRGSTFNHICFWVGWYLLSQPSHAGDRYSDRTPGWVWLSKMIPEAYDDGRYYRFWQTWGALLIIYSLLRIPWLQHLFSRRPLRFLGRISFMLYIVHPLWFRIFGDRMVGLVGNSVDPNLFGSVWDKGLAWAIPDIGPYGFSTRFFVWLAIALPSTMGVAWVCMKTLDEPSVRLGHWVTRKMGLEGERGKGAAVLPA